MNETSVVAVIGILGTAVGALIWIIKYLFDKLLPRIDEGNKVIEKNSHFIQQLAVSTNQNTAITKSADQYLKARNGRDAEMHKELIRAVGEISTKIVETADSAAKALQETPMGQKVEKQEVKTQIVIEKIPGDK